ncbi:hypothetical protein L2X99_11410 [Microbacterium sp. KUDC0406]|uniref:hypothetical protein n=1 Tax=Microbacterium sp. KUDC0406 TaxID=2909588 RepID=UPI001F45BF2B|nr:hypothetical protein [Microbacterium sp. KUDC0406]UJP09072.1 hypothetical protein L2X99_11410 [Microbacterium sp. KUDC0406]
MNTENRLIDALHEGTHRIPGVPAHAERSSGHQGAARRAQSRRRHAAAHRHTAHRPPRVLVAWQQRIAALFGQGRR